MPKAGHDLVAELLLVQRGSGMVADLCVSVSADSEHLAPVRLPSRSGLPSDVTQKVDLASARSVKGRGDRVQSGV